MYYSKLIIIERVEQIEVLIKCSDSQSVFLSLSPEVGLILREKNIKFVNTLQYFTTVDHSTLVMRSHAVIDLLRENYLISEDVFDNESYKVTSFFYLRSVLNYMLLILSIVDNAIKDLGPKEIIISGLSSDNLCSGLEINDYLYISILNDYCKRNNVKFNCINNVKVEGEDKWKRKVVSKVFLFVGHLLYEFQIIFFKLLYKNKKFVIGTGFEYNINRAVDDIADTIQSAVRVYINPSKKDIKNNIVDFIKGRAYFFAYVPSRFIFRKSKIADKYRELTSRYEKLIYKNSALFDFRGVFVGEYILRYFKSPLFSEVKRIECYNYFISRILSLNNILTAVAPHNVGFNAVLGEQCKKKGIPAFVISHGTATLQSGEAMVEWGEHSRYIMGNNFPYILTQTSSQAEFLRNRDKKSRRIIEVNPIIYANIQGYDRYKLKNKLYGNNKNKIIIVHTGTPVQSRFFVPWIYETLEEYVSNINDVIEALRDIPNIYLIIKIRAKHFHATCERDINKLFVKTSNSIIDIGGDFEEFLSTADLLVSYSSTTIEEALHMRVPVMQYDPFRGYQHIQAQAMKKKSVIPEPSPIYFVDDRKELKDSFQWIVDNHINSHKKYEINWSKYSVQRDKHMPDVISGFL
jgi:hypothetical protein